MNKVQVLLYTSYLHVIGGIETFVESWVSIMRKYYDIGLYCPQMPPEMTVRMCQRIFRTLNLYFGTDLESDILAARQLFRQLSFNL